MGVKRGLQPELEQAIHTEVEGVLKKEQVYESHLRTMEARLRRLSKLRKKPQTHKNRSGNATSAVNLTLDSQDPPQPGPTGTSAHDKSLVLATTPVLEKPKAYWTQLLEYQQRKYQQAKQAAAKHKALTRNQVKETWDRQVEEKRLSQLREKQLEAEYGQEMLRQVQQERDSEEQRRAAVRKKLRQEQRELQLQTEGKDRSYMLAIQERRKQEREELLRTEKRLQEMYREHAQAQAREEERRRQTALELAKTIYAYNQSSHQTRHQQLRAAAAQDKKMWGDYSRALAEQEQKHRELHKARQRAGQGFATIANDTNRKHDEDDKAKEEDIKLLAQRLDKEREELSTEARHKAQLKQIARTMNEYLDVQVRLKQRRVAEDKRRSKELADALYKEAEAREQEEQRQAQQVKVRKQALSKALLTQIEEKRDLASTDLEMNEREISINRSALNEVCAYSQRFFGS